MRRSLLNNRGEATAICYLTALNTDGDSSLPRPTPLPGHLAPISHFLDALERGDPFPALSPVLSGVPRSRPSVQPRPPPPLPLGGPRLVYFMRTRNVSSSPALPRYR